MTETKMYFELVMISLMINIPLNDCSNDSSICKDGFVFINLYNQCVLGKRLGDSCLFNKQCKYFDSNTYCDEKRYKCDIKCNIGQELNDKLGKCVVSNFNTTTSKTINVFAILPKTTSPTGVCPFDNRWNKYTQSCEINPFLVNSGTLLLSFGFAIAFIFIILMVYRKRQNESINLFRTLNAFQVSGNPRLGDPIVYFVSVPNDDNTLPTYQEVVNFTPNNNKLPTYEEAIHLSQVNH